MLKSLFKKLFGKPEWITVKRDCWDISTSLALPFIRAGFEVEIWMGTNSEGHPSHTEACVVKDGKRLWLRESGQNCVVADPDYASGFDKIICYDFFRFIDIVYNSKEFQKDKIVEGGSKHD